MEANVNLLPCAHCGSDNVHLRYETPPTVNVGDRPSWYIACDDCGMRTNTYYGDHYDYATTIAIGNAVEAWNKRVIPSASLEQLDPTPKSNDELVAIIKRATDELTTRANKLIDDICSIIESKENEGDING